MKFSLIKGHLRKKDQKKGKRKEEEEEGIETRGSSW